MIRRSSPLALVPVFALLAGCGDANMPISFDRITGNGGAGAASAGFCSGTGGTKINALGGKLDCLSFAVVGDTRPPSIDNTAQYPSAIITRIYQDLETESPRPPFGITTGDYQFASTTGSEAAAQFDLYLQAESAFSSPMFHAMGNHECTGATTSNCATAASHTKNYDAFMSKFLQPQGITEPYFSQTVHATDGSWSAKFVYIAANAWNATQAAWLDQVLSVPTTYTFIVRHEASYATTAPGVTPSGQIIAQHPFTLLIAGHTHTYEHLPSKKEMIIGLGGAPLVSAINYGYALARMRTDGAIQFFVYDYESHALIDSFAVDKDGNAVATINGTPTPTPTPHGSPTPQPTPSDYIVNGGFENGFLGWLPGGVKIPILSTAEAHGGTHAVRCGSTTTEPAGDSWAYQSVGIPQSATSATLRFWYFTKTADSVSHDWQEALIRDDTGATLKTIFHMADNSAVWTEKTVDLTSERGKTVQIYFNVHGKSGDQPTAMWIDDVSVEIQ